jgi:Arc/MetJ-type ribon-helix-helix transcriptional regulator
VVIRLPQHLRHRIEQAADRDRRANMSEYLRNLISDALDARDHPAA